MYTHLTPLLAALLSVAGPPPAPQASLVRSPGESIVTEIGGKNLKQWLDDLKKPDASVREEAIRALVYFRQDWPQIVKPLVERLRDSDSSPRVRAAIALGMIDVPKALVPDVVRALNQRLLEDPQSIVRYYAATTLGNFGEASREALAGLNQGVSDRATWEIRHACIVVLRTAGRDANRAPIASAENALLQALNDPTSLVRLDAIMAIGELGRPDDATMKLRIAAGLSGRFNDRDPTVRLWAYAAMMALDENIDQKHMQALIKFLKPTDHPEAKVRVNAARALGTLGNRAKTAVPALVEALDDKEPSVVGMASWALMQMDGLTGSPREALLAVLRNQDPAVRVAGAQALGNGGAKAKTAVPALAEMLQDKNQPPTVLSAGCWALGEIAEPDPSAITALKGVRDRVDVDDSVKQYARTALDQISKLRK